MSDIQQEIDEFTHFLQETIPPDDIYIFAHVAMTMAHYMLKKIDELDVNDVAYDDEILSKYRENVAMYFIAKQQKIKMKWGYKDD